MTGGTTASEPAVEPTILSAQSMHVPAQGARAAMVIDLTVGEGELHLLFTRYKECSTAIADGLLGVGAPGDGSVRFLGKHWHELTRYEAFSLRRGVGRIRSSGNWMGTRSVLEDLLIPSMHHTLLPESQLLENASALAQRFGLPGLPTGLPHECAAADLERAACVRAFFGRPALVILEHPMEFVDSSLLTPMMDAIQRVRRRGGSVLWFTEHLAHVTDPSIPADGRYRLAGARLLAVRPGR